MSPQQIVEALIARGWNAEIVLAASVDDLVPVDSSGLMKCVDGRPSDHPGMRGPKALGGIYAIASLRGIGTTDGISDVVNEVTDAGHVPSVHGDGHNDAMGCGYFKLWSEGQLLDLDPPQFSAEEGKQTVLDTGGIYETLIGDHDEKVVMINLVPDTTLEPKADDQRFVVDGWVADTFALDVGTYLTLGAVTVEKLGGPMSAKIIIP